MEEEKVAFEESRIEKPENKFVFEINQLTAVRILVCRFELVEWARSNSNPCRISLIII